MQQSINNVKRVYAHKDSEMIIGGAAILDNAIDNQAMLAEADATYTPDYLYQVRQRFDNAARDILGADNALALRQTSIDLYNMHDEAMHDLGLTKVLIENKYQKSPARLNEILTTLGFKTYYTHSGNRAQAAMGQLLSRFDVNLTKELEAELSTKGLPTSRIKRLREYAKIYNTTNIKQEGNKDRRSLLTEENIHTLNELYEEAIAICKMAQRIFKSFPALYSGFVFDKMISKQSSYHDVDREYSEKGE